MYIFWLKYTGWLKFHPDSTVLTTIWPLVTSERSWYRHFWNQQKKCYPLICISPRLKCVFFKIPISVDIGSFDVDLTPKRSKFDQTKGRSEILTIFSYNIRGQKWWLIMSHISSVSTSYEILNDRRLDFFHDRFIDMIWTNSNWLYWWRKHSEYTVWM